MPEKNKSSVVENAVSVSDIMTNGDDVSAATGNGGGATAGTENASAASHVVESANVASSVTVNADVAAMNIIKQNIAWAVAAGLLPVPFVEVAAITAVEVKLIRELAEHFKVPFQKDLAKSAVASLLASLGSVALGKYVARSAFRFLPVIGPVVAAASVSVMSSAFTYAVGRVFAVHFATGGSLLDFNIENLREFFRNEFAIGMKEAASLRTAAAPAQ
jgi:uncharacterized protein (DUF697 family)